METATENKRLIGMADYVLQQGNIGMEVQSINHQMSDMARRFYLIQQYANFLKQPLELGFFIACDENGNVLEEPSCMYIYKTQVYECSADEMYRCRTYLEAKDRVLFSGFEANNCKDYFLVTLNDNHVWVSWNKSKTIEDLVPYNLEIAK